MTEGEIRQGCGVCSGNFEGSECKGLIENDNPRLTPQELCVLALSEILDQNRLNGGDQSMPHAWACLEQALSNDTPLYAQHREDMLDEAFATADTILRNPDKRSIDEQFLDETFQAASLKNYEGIFRTLAGGLPVTPQALYETRQNIGALIVAIDENPDLPQEFDGLVRGFIAEQTVQWLSLNNARLSEDPELVIYPTSHREGHARGHLVAFNHDGYQLRSFGRVRIEVKRRRRYGNWRGRNTYDRSIVYVVLQDILDKVRSKHGGKVGSARDNFLIGAIRDTQRNRNSGPSIQVLRSAGEFLQQHIDEKATVAA